LSSADPAGELIRSRDVLAGVSLNQWQRRKEQKKNKKLIRRWDSERELYVRRHRTRTTKYNRLVHSATDRRGGYAWNACLPVYQIQWNNAM